MYFVLWVCVMLTNNSPCAWAQDPTCPKSLQGASLVAPMTSVLDQFLVLSDIENFDIVSEAKYNWWISVNREEPSFVFAPRVETLM